MGNRTRIMNRKYLFFISDAMAMKACSTLVAFFALASINGMPISSANALYVNQELFQSIEKDCTRRTNPKKENEKNARSYLCCII